MEYTWQKNGKQYKAVIEQDPDNTHGWSFALTESSHVEGKRGQHAWCHRGGGYQSERGCLRACAAAYKRRAGLSQSADYLMLVTFGHIGEETK